jgi:hypothetical protein
MKIRVDEIFSKKEDIINCDLTHNGVTYKNLIDIEKDSYSDENNKAYTDYKLIFKNELKFEDIDNLRVAGEMLTFECNKEDVMLTNEKEDGSKREVNLISSYGGRKRKTHKRKLQRRRGSRRK